MTATHAADTVEGAGSTDASAVQAVVPAFDGLRGIAALAIVVYHCWVVAGRPVLDGGPIYALFGGLSLGVDMFFVISGFVLFLPVVRNGTLGAVPEFALRRGARIFPAYYVALLGVLVLWPFVNLGLTPYPLTYGDGLIATGLHLPMFQGFTLGAIAPVLGNDVRVGLGVNTILWTLTVEICFYIVLPFVAKAYRRHPIALLVVAVALTEMWRYSAGHLDGVAAFFGFGSLSATDSVAIGRQMLSQLPAFLSHFAIGMTLAWLYVRVASRTRRPSPRIVVPGVLVSGVAMVIAWWAFGHVILNSPEGADYLRYGAPLVFAVAFAGLAGFMLFAPSLVQWPVANDRARWLGDISYGVYLWHLFPILFAYRTLELTGADQGRTMVALLLFSAPIALYAGALSRTYVERPAIEWARRVIARRRVATAAPSLVAASPT